MFAADRMGVIDIIMSETVSSFDMAAKGDKLFLATDKGLLSSNTNDSQVCVIS